MSKLGRILLSVLPIVLLACEPASEERDRLEIQRQLEAAKFTDIKLAQATTADGVVNDGDCAILSRGEWVEVLNPEGVQSSNNEFPFGDTCVTDAGSTVEVEGWQGDGSVLVSLRYPWSARGTECPNGTLLAMPPKEFLSTTEDYIRAQDEAGRRRRGVSDALAGEEP